MDLHLRIRLVPPQRLAGVASQMVLLNQAVLPVVGLALYALGERPYVLSTLMGLAVGASLLATLRIYRQLRASALPAAPAKPVS